MDLVNTLTGEDRPLKREKNARPQLGCLRACIFSHGIIGFKIRSPSSGWFQMICIIYVCIYIHREKYRGLLPSNSAKLRIHGDQASILKVITQIHVAKHCSIVPSRYAAVGMALAFRPECCDSGVPLPTSVSMVWQSKFATEMSADANEE